jgi:hypothetical protein
MGAGLGAAREVRKAPTGYTIGADGDIINTVPPIRVLL